MDNLYLKHCQELLNLYQEIVNYEIKDQIQQLDFEVNINRLRKEIFSIITKNNYGYDTVSLRLPPGESNWVDKKERVETGGIAPMYYDLRGPEFREEFNYRPNTEYTEWHPDLTEDSYIKSMISSIEDHVGFKIGRVRLAWQAPNFGYTLHSDYEPMRLHIPIITNKHAWFIHDEKIHQMEYGKLYHLITSGPHTAHNYGVLPRLHLILSTYGTDDIMEKVFELKDPNKSTDNMVDTIKDHGVDNQSLGVLLQIEKNEKLIGQDNLVLINKLLKEK